MNDRMTALVFDRYGPPDVLRLAEVPVPVPGDDDVLIEVCATSVNASDIEFLTASPAYIRAWGLLKPKCRILGSDVAGRVVAVGKDVTRFEPGDAVFGDLLFLFGGFAEYLAAPAKELSIKPEALSFEVAAALPQSACVALEGIGDAGELRAGQHVAINGAGGGAGTFAVQMAKNIGAEVTAIDSAAKSEIMGSLGADHIIDYGREDFTRNEGRYDLILDFVASHSIFDYQGALRPGGRYLMVGGHIRHIFQTQVLGTLMSKMGDKRLAMLMAVPNKGLDEVAALVEGGDLKAVIDTTYALSDGAEALRHVAEGRACGKVVVTPSGQPGLSARE